MSKNHTRTYIKFNLIAQSRKPHSPQSFCQKILSSLPCSSTSLDHNLNVIFREISPQMEKSRRKFPFCYVSLFFFVFIYFIKRYLIYCCFNLRLAKCLLIYFIAKEEFLFSLMYKFNYPGFFKYFLWVLDFHI